MDNLRRGIIIKIDSSKSWVAENGAIYQADIKQSLLRSYKPLVGDKVDFKVINDQEKSGLIIGFQARTNILPRPKIANIDQAIIVTSLKEPDFNSYLLNKYLIFLNFLKIKPILLFTKRDLTNKKLDTELLKKVNIYEELGYKILIMSNKVPRKEDMKILTQILEDKISVLVGQTGAGKSTTLNRFLEGMPSIKTQEISQALSRGKHTTTTTQLYSLGPKILVADTPGFGNFDLRNLKIQDLIYDLPLLKPYLGNCKYPDCLHVLEKTCSLKQRNIFSPEFQFIYEDYCRIINELMTKRGKSYEKTHNHT